MKLENLKHTEGARKEPTRRGIGDSSAGRGEKGYSKREGNARKLGFEGGQTPLYRRIPKRGFTNPTREEYDIVGLDTLAELTFTDINPTTLQENDVYKPRQGKLKILGNTISKAITVKAHAFSRPAQEAIIAAGGTIEIIPSPRSSGSNSHFNRNRNSNGGSFNRDRNSGGGSSFSRDRRPSSGGRSFGGDRNSGGGSSFGDRRPSEGRSFDRDRKPSSGGRSYGGDRNSGGGSSYSRDRRPSEGRSFDRDRKPSSGRSFEKNDNLDKN